MLIDKYIKIKVNSRDIKYLNDLGYSNLKVNNEIFIKIKDLKENSYRKVKCKCEICNSLNEIAYQKYNENKKRGGKYTCKYCNNQQLRKTCLERYGVDNPLKINEIKEKIQKTCIEKYGVKNVNKLKFIKEAKIKTFLKNYNVTHPMKDKEIKEKCNNARIKSGYIKKYDIKNKFNDYKKRVINLTYKNKKKLFENWNGYDFYDNEFIKNNFNLNYFDSDYPTIDHKISIKYGFENKIPPEELAELNNLCITKQSINKKKSYKTYLEFKNSSSL